MAIKIIYKDADTDTELAEDLVDDEEIKALGAELACESYPSVLFLNWHRNAIHNKSRQMIDQIVGEALSDNPNSSLSSEDKQALRNYLDANDIVLMDVKQLPPKVKREIVKRAVVKTAAERSAELLDKG